MLEHFKEWVELTLSPQKYTFAQGMWQEDAKSAATWFCVLKAMGGPSRDVDDRRPRFRVLLVGPRNGRAEMRPLMADLEALMMAATGELLPCGAASVRTLTEPVGPEFTTENRPWCSVDFQVIF